MREWMVQWQEIEEPTAPAFNVKLPLGCSRLGWA
jgi:hypothetical protein